MLQSWFHTPAWERSQPSFTSSPEPALGPLLSSLAKTDLDKVAKSHESQSIITGCKTIASYNWLDKAEPTIIVPGMSVPRTKSAGTQGEPPSLCCADRIQGNRPNGRRFPSRTS